LPSSKVKLRLFLERIFILKK